MVHLQDKINEFCLKCTKIFLRRLVLGGGSVIIGCREKKFFIENSQVAKAEFCKNLNCSVSKISFLELDLSSLTSVKKFCQNVSNEFPIIGKLNMKNRL